MQNQVRWSLLAAAMLVAQTGCSGGGAPTSPNASNQSYSLTIAPRDTTIVMGDTVRFTATVRDASGKVIPELVAWSWSRCEFVAFIDTDGPQDDKLRLRGKAPGEVTVYVDGQSITVGSGRTLHGEATLNIVALPDQAVADVTCE